MNLRRTRVSLWQIVVITACTRVGWDIGLALSGRNPHHDSVVAYHNFLKSAYDANGGKVNGRPQPAPH